MKKVIIIILFIIISYSIFGQEYYGINYGADGLGNECVGRGWHQEMSYRFTCEYTGTVTSAVIYIMYASGYGAGTGGVMVMTLETDDGTSNHLPSGTILTSVTDNNLLSHGGSEARVIYTFNTPVEIDSGTIYHLHFVNTDPDPVNNWYSVDLLYVHSPHSFYDLMPTGSYTKLAALYKVNTTWTSTELDHTPIYTLIYDDAELRGQGLDLTGVTSYTRNINGTNFKVRNNITVTEKTRIVQKIWVRVRRVSGVDSLILRLEESDGTLLKRCAIAASGIVATDMTWAGVSLITPITLYIGHSYHLELSTASGTTYQTFHLRNSTFSGFVPMFPDGYIQYMINGVDWIEQDWVPTLCKMQSYFEVTYPPPPILGTAVTYQPSYISTRYATVQGAIIFDGGDYINEKGICWSESINPTITDDHTDNGARTGSFTNSIGPLVANTTYHIRTYGTSGIGTFYGDDISFTTPVYNIVKSGDKKATNGINIIILK